MSQNDFGNGSGFILHLILCSLVVVGAFVGLLWLWFVIGFGYMSDDLRRSATSYLEDYLSGQIPLAGEASGQLHFNFLPQANVKIIAVKFKPDYLATLLEPCRTARCLVMDKFYQVSVTHEANGTLTKERFLMVWNPSSYYWTIEEVDK